MRGEFRRRHPAKTGLVETCPDGIMGRERICFGRREEIAMSMFGKICFVGGKNGIVGVGGGFSGSANGQDRWEPTADLIEVEGGFLVQIDLPGVDAVSIEAVVDGQRLMVRGIRSAICPSRSKRYIHMEVSRGEFGKVIHLPEPVAEENCQARMQDGVLEIFLPFGQRPAFSVTTLTIRTIIQT